MFRFINYYPNNILTAETVLWELGSTLSGNQYTVHNLWAPVYITLNLGATGTFIMGTSLQNLWLDTSTSILGNSLYYTDYWTQNTSYQPGELVYIILVPVLIFWDTAYSISTLGTSLYYFVVGTSLHYLACGYQYLDFYWSFEDGSFNTVILVICLFYVITYWISLGCIMLKRIVFYSFYTLVNCLHMS